MSGTLRPLDSNLMLEWHQHQQHWLKRVVLCQLHRTLLHMFYTPMSWFLSCLCTNQENNLHKYFLEQ